MTTSREAPSIDLISFLKSLPDYRMRRGIRIPAVVEAVDVVLSIYCCTEG
jgi:hypothetical protein